VPEPTTGVGRVAGLDEVYPPRLDRLAALQIDLATANVDADRPAHRRVVQEVASNHVAEVAERHHKLTHAVVRVMFHDVPEDRASAYLDHRLWPDVGFFGEAGPEATGEDDGFHRPVL